MAEKKPPRRPDGHPELRNLDDMLRAAVSEEEYRNLPGKGKPLDLTDYYRADAASRASLRLLKDNKVLPRHLQDRKEAEQALNQAESALAGQEAALSDLRGRISATATRLAGCVRNADSLAELVGIEPWPFGEIPATATGRIRFREVAAEVRLFADLLAAHDRNRHGALTAYLDGLTRAQTHLARYQQDVAAGGHLLPPFPSLRRLDVDRLSAQAVARIPVMPHPPEDLAARLAVFRHTNRLPLLKRILP